MTEKQQPRWSEIGFVRQELMYGSCRPIQKIIIIGGGLCGLALANALVQLRRHGNFSSLSAPVVLEAAENLCKLPGTGSSVRLYEPVCRSLWKSLNMADDLIKEQPFSHPGWRRGSKSGGKAGQLFGGRLPPPSLNTRMLSFQHSHLVNLMTYRIDGFAAEALGREIEERDPEERERYFGERTDHLPIINFGKRVIDIQPFAESVVVRCEDGTVVRGDLAVVCTGSRGEPPELPFFVGKAKPQYATPKEEQTDEWYPHMYGISPAQFNHAPNFDFFDRRTGMRFVVSPTAQGYLHWHLAGKQRGQNAEALIAQAKDVLHPQAAWVLDRTLPETIATRLLPRRRTPLMTGPWHFRDRIVYMGGHLGDLGHYDVFDVDPNLAIEEALEFAAIVQRFNDRSSRLSRLRFYYKDFPECALEFFRARRLDRRRFLRYYSRIFSPFSFSLGLSLFNRIAPSFLHSRLAGQFPPPVFYYEPPEESDDE